MYNCKIDIVLLHMITEILIPKKGTVKKRGKEIFLIIVSFGEDTRS